MQRAELINALATGAEPYSKNRSFILKTRGDGGVVGRTLVGPGAEVGVQDGPTHHQPGDTEYIKDLKGNEHQARRWSGQTYTYTRLGRTYYDANTAKFVVSVPARIEGRRGAGRNHRRDGETYERRAWMPVSHFGVGEIELSERLTAAEKQIRIKKLVLDSVGADAGDAEVLLHQESSQHWLLDPSPEWWFSKLEVIEQAGRRWAQNGGACVQEPGGDTDGAQLLAMSGVYPRGGLDRGELRPPTARRAPPGPLVRGRMPD